MSRRNSSSVARMMRRSRLRGVSWDSIHPVEVLGKALRSVEMGCMMAERDRVVHKPSAGYWRRRPASQVAAVRTVRELRAGCSRARPFGTQSPRI